MLIKAVCIGIAELQPVLIYSIPDILLDSAIKFVDSYVKRWRDLG